MKWNYPGKCYSNCDWLALHFRMLLILKRNCPIHCYCFIYIYIYIYIVIVIVLYIYVQFSLLCWGPLQGPLIKAIAKKVYTQVQEASLDSWFRSNLLTIQSCSNCLLLWLGSKNTKAQNILVTRGPCNGPQHKRDNCTYIHYYLEWDFHCM
jgi:hypothetical protein